MNQQTSEQVATQCMIMIMPLLDETLNPKQLIELKKSICDKHGLSYRTINRYQSVYEALDLMA